MDIAGSQAAVMAIGFLYLVFTLGCLALVDLAATKAGTSAAVPLSTVRTTHATKPTPNYCHPTQKHELSQQFKRPAVGGCTTSYPRSEALVVLAQ
ncbi:hypothetical protein C7B79_35495 [Chroococcidiopsis cubana CCALA 043]|uniref:hypothetical protein n=1 Tax=Chroococcidiopsis cubana TaxID=171392 RepID=UPI000D059A76|nr:hypothetical protein C7B79_35495 [Chroococcidiopsis cubana CCALA 043]